MKDPVIASDGLTYDRVMIEEWFKHDDRMSPGHGGPLVSTVIVPNIAVRQLIEAEMTKRGFSSVEEWRAHENKSGAG